MNPTSRPDPRTARPWWPRRERRVYQPDAGDLGTAFGMELRLGEREAQGLAGIDAAQPQVVVAPWWSRLLRRPVAGH